MAETDATKRKEPEAETKEAPAAAKDAPVVEKEEKKEPEAKRQKTLASDPAAVRKQVEYYMSDENLKHDKFFHDKMSADGDGWLEIAMILSCNKMKALRASKEDVVAALKESKLELKDEGAFVRRPANAALPKLEERAQHGKKSSLHAHDGGVMAVFRNVPEEQSWLQVKEKLKAALPEKANLWFVSEVSDKNLCFIATAPFDGDVEFFEKIELELGGSKVKADLCHSDTLQQGLKLLPKHIRERREKESRKRQKDRNKPIQVGTQKFINVGALRGRVKEILNSRSDGEHLKPDGSDFKLIKGLLEFHPKGGEKSKGMVGIKVAQSSQGDNRCFFMVKEDGSAEDFSAKKCLDAVEANPPYVKVEPPKERVGEKKVEEEKKAEADKAEPPKAEAVKAEPPKEKVEEKKVEAEKQPEVDKAEPPTETPADEKKPDEEMKPAEEKKTE